jgi:uncharacterized protein YqgC (DUF456 family)
LLFEAKALVWIYYILLILIATAGLFMVMVTLPGLWLMAAVSAGYCLLTHQHYLGIKSLVALLILALLGEAAEMGIGGAAARKAGGGRRAALGGIIGGIVGGVVGSFVFPLVLSIVGVCLGSFVGAALLEMLGGESADHSLRIGIGAAKGKFMGIIVKLGIGLAMLALIALSALPI